MGVSGSYLVLKVDGSVIAETTSVNLKIIAKGLDRTSQASGVNASFMAGKIKIGIAGAFLFASDGANWTALYDFLKAGTEFEVVFYNNGTEFFGGSGVMKKLSIRGANQKSLVTGSYGIRFTPTADAILTEGGLEITTEDGRVLIIE